MEKCYEIVFTINPELAEEERKGILQKVEDIVKKFKGRILSVEEWGKMRLAYAIRKFLEGYYVKVDFTGVSQAVKEIERLLRLNEKVLRYQTVRVNKDVTSLKEEDSKASEDIDV